METHSTNQVTAFEGVHCIASGDLASVTEAVRQAASQVKTATVLVFDNQTGDQVDLNLRDEIAPDRTTPSEPQPSPTGQRGAGRPRLGVVAREVTLLPRHWEWLSEQRGGASATLRRLIEQARKDNANAAERQQARESLYRFMTAIAGNAAGYEEALRALFGGNIDGFQNATESWPVDIRKFMGRLIPTAFEQASS